MSRLEYVDGDARWYISDESGMREPMPNESVAREMAVAASFGTSDYVYVERDANGSWEVLATFQRGELI